LRSRQSLRRGLDGVALKAVGYRCALMDPPDTSLRVCGLSCLRRPGVARRTAGIGATSPLTVGSARDRSPPGPEIQRASTRAEPSGTRTDAPVVRVERAGRSRRPAIHKLTGFVRPILSIRGSRAPTMTIVPFSTPRYRNALAIRYSASASTGPPVSARSRCTSSRTARRISSGSPASAWPVEAPPRSNGP